jgi:hypothetical protein
MRLIFTHLLLVTGLVLAGGDAAAQSRSDTGRHRPAPQRPEPALADSLPPPPPPPGWFLGMTGGVVAGSDLFTVDVPSGVPLRWVAAAPFSSDHFDAVLDGAAQFGLFLGRRLGGHASVRLDLGWSGMAVAAEARTGQVGDVYRFDRFVVATGALGAEFRLVRTASHPYLGVGLAVLRIDPDRTPDLAQTRLGARVSLGYQKVLTPEWSLRLEGRVNRTGFAVGDFEPATERPGDEPITVTGQSDLTTWSLVLGVQVEL